ncbi:hypothetical protein [Streptomyces sp. NPDC005970]|uniref:hypothetical protein n=1 Tax=Streptomyces sp. NPDC005970 TaxID=3156723 RepID=UPI0033E94145
MKLKPSRSGSTGRPAQTRRLTADEQAQLDEETTVEACRVDYALGAEARARLDRASKEKANRLGISRKKATG